MLEETNDNLHNADGNLETQEETISTESKIAEEISPNEEVVLYTENHSVMDVIANENAAESEDESLENRQEIQMLDYDSMDLESLIDELEKLTSTDKVMSVKDHVEGIKTAFLSKFNHFIEIKKVEFEAENIDSKEQFHYHSPLKLKLDQLYTDYRNRKNAHFKNLQTNLQTNLNNRLAIVEELKSLANTADSISSALKQLNDIRDRWKTAGPIPKDKYNHVWNNYHFHIENFYDFLHLDREARDLDFKHNLESKLKIISRCEELVNEEDTLKAFRELQGLHKLWKEEIGPVSREHREEIWKKFSELTKQMHDKRELIYQQLRGNETENLAKKEDIIAKLEVLASEKVDSHNLWIEQTAKVETLRNEYLVIGKVPVEHLDATWNKFKTVVKNFNIIKNSFYKDIKKEQTDNLAKKQALIEKVKELQNNTDFVKTTPIMKQLQEEWKTIGHVPLKFSDKVWKEFRAICNHYFDNMKEQKNVENPDEVASFEKKKEYMETLRLFEMTGDHKTDLDAIKLHIETWKSFGRVPMQRRHIEAKFNKILDALFEKLSLSKKDSDMMRFSKRMDQLSESNDVKKIEGEKIFLMRKIDEVQNNIFQLENNIQFFANTKNAKKENSIVTEVRKNIEIHKEEMAVLKEKLKQLKNMKQE